MSAPDAAAPGGRGATVAVHAALLPLWRGLVVFRLVALVYAVVSVVRDVDGYARPALGVAVVSGDHERLGFDEGVAVPVEGLEPVTTTRPARP